MPRLSDEPGQRIRDRHREENIPRNRLAVGRCLRDRCPKACSWTLNTGPQRLMLPQCQRNCKSAHRRFQSWCEREMLRAILIGLADDLHDGGAIDEAECVLDATSAGATGGRPGIGPTRRGKGLEMVERAGPPGRAGPNSGRYPRTLSRARPRRLPRRPDYNPPGVRLPRGPQTSMRPMPPDIGEPGCLPGDANVEFRLRRRLIPAHAESGGPQQSVARARAGERRDPP